MFAVVMIATLIQTLPEVKVVSHSWQETLIMQLPAILTGLATLVGVITTGVKLIRGQQAAAVVQEVATAKASVAAEEATKANQLLRDTHNLVTEDRGTALVVHAAMADRIASLTNDPQDIRMAAVTKQALDEHNAVKEAQV